MADRPTLSIVAEGAKTEGDSEPSEPEAAQPEAPPPAPPFLQAPPAPAHPVGRMSLSDAQDSWIISAEPYVIEMARRLFRAGRSLGSQQVTIPATKRNMGNLNWLLLRFPMEIENRDIYDRMLRDAQQHAEMFAQAQENPRRIAPPLLLPLLPYQEEGVAHLVNHTRTLLADEPGLGKAQPLDAAVLTPMGWRQIGDLRPGDEVCDPATGGKARVVSIHPQGIKPVFRVEFSDKSWAVSCREHLWVYNTPSRIKAGLPYLRAELRAIENYLAERKKKREPAHLLLTKPLELGDGTEDQPIDPWLLGVLLCRLTPERTALVLTRVGKLTAEISERLPRGLCIKHSFRGAWTISRRQRKTHPLLRDVTALKILGTRRSERRIPEAYIFTTAEKRRTLLRGLMDAAHVADNRTTRPDRRVRFRHQSRELAEQVIFLVRSLGGTATLEKESEKDLWVALIRTPDNPFFARAGEWDNYGVPERRLLDVFSSHPDEAECVCIRLDSPSGLYLTDDLLVTHNTPQALGFLLHTQAWPALVVTPPHILTQWPDEIRKFLGPSCTLHVIKGQRPYELPPRHIYLIHYLLLAYWRRALRAANPATVVFDEIQELRHHDTSKYTGAAHIASVAQNVLGLSGTPIHNHGIEIWSVLNIIEPNCLGARDHFSKEWCTEGTIVSQPEILGSHLRREGLFLRRRKEDVLPDLPAKRRVVQKIGLDEAVYAPLIERAIAAALAVPSAKDHFTAKRMRQVAIEHSRQAVGIAKAPYVAAFVRALLEADEPVLLYAYHHLVFDAYMKHLAEWQPVEISGRVNAGEKQKAGKAFGDAKTNLAVVSLRSGSGLNALKRARCVVFGELDWSPAINEQCEDRAAGGLRAAGKDSVLAYYLVAPEGADREIQAHLGLKVSQFVGLMGDRAETAEDQSLAAKSAERHMASLLTRLQKMGKVPGTPVSSVGTEQSHQ